MCGINRYARRASAISRVPCRFETHPAKAMALWVLLCCCRWRLRGPCKAASVPAPVSSRGGARRLRRVVLLNQNRSTAPRRWGARWAPLRTACRQCDEGRRNNSARHADSVGGAVGCVLLAPAAHAVENASVLNVGAASSRRRCRNRAIGGPIGSGNFNRKMCSREVRKAPPPDSVQGASRCPGKDASGYHVKGQVLASASGAIRQPKNSREGGERNVALDAAKSEP